jgi:hypothetical protein
VSLRGQAVIPLSQRAMGALNEISGAVESINGAGISWGVPGIFTGIGNSFREGPP